MVHQDKIDDTPKEHQIHHRVGHWLPLDHRKHKAWLDDKIKHVDNNPKDLHPVLVEFKDLIEGSTRLYMFVQSMFEQVPQKKPYFDDPEHHRQVRDYMHMLQLFNHLLTTAPEWSNQAYGIGFVGVPFNAVLDWPMGTPSGFAFFLDPEVNAMCKKMLDVWGEFLSSPKSAYVLGDDSIGWFNKDSQGDLTTTANTGSADRSFEETFICDPKAEHHGYKSWDDFFTRHIKEEVRPIASPDDDSVIANCCESKPFNVSTDVKERDTFWVKGQPYSIIDMLGHDDLHKEFVGGTVYQAFLSALSYHRWHSPVSGKVVKAFVQPGTYFSEPLFDGIGDPSVKDIDPHGATNGQGYLTATATRAIIFIEADNPDIGLIAFIGIGMTEVSTCDITVKEGQHIKKSDQIGMFHFGGSTHCVLFRKGVQLEGFPSTDKPKWNVHVKSKLCTVKKGSKA